MAALQRKIAELEKTLASKKAPSINQNPTCEVPVSEVDGVKMTAKEIRAAKAAAAAEKTETNTEEEQSAEDSGMYGEESEEEEETQETPPPPSVAPTPPCSAVAIPKTGDKINSSTHKCEYNRLMRHMQSNATQFPNMAQLWNGNNKETFSYLICSWNGTAL